MQPIPTLAIPRPPLSTPVRVGRNRGLDHYNNQNGSFKPPLAPQMQSRTPSPTSLTNNGNTSNRHLDNHRNIHAQGPESYLWAYQIHVENRFLAARLNALETHCRNDLNHSLGRQVGEKIESDVKALREEITAAVSGCLPQKEFEEAIKKLNEACEHRAQEVKCLHTEEKNIFHRHLQALQENYQSLAPKVQQMETDSGGNWDLLKRDLDDTKSSLQRSLQEIEEAHPRRMSSLEDKFYKHTGDLKNYIDNALENEKETRLALAHRHQQIEGELRTRISNSSAEIERLQETIQATAKDVQRHFGKADTLLGKLDASLRQTSSMSERMSAFERDLTALRNSLNEVSCSVIRHNDGSEHNDSARWQASSKAIPSQIVPDGSTTISHPPRPTSRGIPDINVQCQTLHNQGQIPSPCKSLPKRTSFSSSKPNAPSRFEPDRPPKIRDSGTKNSSPCYTPASRNQNCSSVVPESSPTKVLSVPPERNDKKPSSGIKRVSIQHGTDFVYTGLDCSNSFPQSHPSSQKGHAPRGHATKEDNNSSNKHERISPSYVPESSFRISQDQENFPQYLYECPLMDRHLEKDYMTGGMATISTDRHNPPSPLVHDKRHQCARVISNSQPPGSIIEDAKTEGNHRASKPDIADNEDQPVVTYVKSTVSKRGSEMPAPKLQKERNPVDGSGTPLSNEQGPSLQRKKPRKRRRVIPLVWTEAEEN